MKICLNKKTSSYFKLELAIKVESGANGVYQFFVAKKIN